MYPTDDCPLAVAAGVAVIGGAVTLACGVVVATAVREVSVADCVSGGVILPVTVGDLVLD
jgi:hypothetical protein